jgi:hypothetical protein
MGSFVMSDDGRPVENAESSDEDADAAQLDVESSAESTGPGPEGAATTQEADAPAAASGAPPVAAHSSAELSRALQAFKKRLKLTKLDSESKLGYGPMTGGRPSGIVAITPPREYPRSVWDALVEQGRLKRGSQGMYELA